MKCKIKKIYIYNPKLFKLTLNSASHFYPVFLKYNLHTWFKEHNF